MPFQQDFSDRRCHRQPPAGAVLVCALLLSLAGNSLAQDAGPARRAWSVEPTLSLRETFTDNYRLQTTKASDAITEATAGVRVTANAGMVRGFLDYSLTGSAHSRHSDANEVRHFLNAASTAELARMSSLPSGRIPLPASRMIMWSPQRTSTHGVLPP